MYDVRFGEFPRLRARDAEQMRSGILKAVRGCSEKAAVAGGAPPMYDVRFSVYNTHDGPDEGARVAGGKCGWTKAQPLPAGRTGRAVPVSQFGEFARMRAGLGITIIRLLPVYSWEFTGLRADFGVGGWGGCARSIISRG